MPKIPKSRGTIAANDPLGRTGGIAEYAEYDADKYKHDSDYLALGIGRIGGFAALLFSVS